MDAKNALRAPLKPILDLLDRRVLNLAKLIDAKTDELQKPLSQFAQFAKAAAAAQQEQAQAAEAAQAQTAQAIQAVLSQNGSALQPVIAGLGDLRQELVGTEQRVNQQLHELIRTTLGTQESYLESLSYVGRALREVRDEIDRRSEATTALGTQINAALDRFAAQVAPFTGLAAGAPADLDQASSAFLNYANSHRGFAAQAGLWINHPVQIAHEPGRVRFDSVNERIVEVPFVFSAVASLPPGARVLDVGGTESTVALSLASLGCSVTVIDARGYPFPHPSLRVVETTLEAWDEAPGSYDAIVCLSTIEHIGLGAYDTPRLPDDADRRAMRRLRDLARPGGVLALTVPFGARARDDFQRTYDRPALDALLGDWRVTSMSAVEQRAPQVWTPVGIDEPVGEARRVALVMASAT